MKDQLKIGFILFTGIFLSAVPFLPADPTPQIMSILRKKANAGGGGTPAFNREGSNNESASSTTITVTGFDIDAGDTILVQLAGTVTHAQSVSNGTENGTEIAATLWDDGTAYFSSVWVIENCTNNDSATITVTWDQAVDFRNIHVASFTGVASSSSVLSADAEDAGTLPTASTNRTVSNDITEGPAMFVCFSQAWDFAATLTAAASWTLGDTASSGSQLSAMAYRYVSSSTTLPNGNFATSGASDEYIPFVIALDPE